mmetsp:Transcript_16086/g.40762  ORF Transcript_16086/g.40762 Transcript_16086/m.40762 type:complete len:263 (+) Transcript_16086:137-925(+)
MLRPLMPQPVSSSCVLATGVPAPCRLSCWIYLVVLPSVPVMCMWPRAPQPVPTPATGVPHASTAMRSFVQAAAYCGRTVPSWKCIEGINAHGHAHGRAHGHDHGHRRARGRGRDRACPPSCQGPTLRGMGRAAPPSSRLRPPFLHPSAGTCLAPLLPPHARAPGRCRQVPSGDRRAFRPTMGGCTPRGRRATTRGPSPPTTVGQVSVQIACLRALRVLVGHAAKRATRCPSPAGGGRGGLDAAGCKAHHGDAADGKASSRGI